MFETVLTDRKTDRDNSVIFSFLKNNKGLKTLSTIVDSVFCVLYE